MTELFTLDETAKKLRVSRRWLQGFLRNRPYGRMAGRRRVFTESDITAIIESLPCPSSSFPRVRVGRRTGVSVVRTSDNALIKLRERLIGNSQPVHFTKSVMTLSKEYLPLEAPQVLPLQPCDILKPVVKTASSCGSLNISETDR